MQLTHEQLSLELHAVPEITHLQALVLRIVSQKDWQSSKEVKDCLKNFGISQARPTFFLLMQRLENSGYVESKPISQVFSGYDFPYSVYRCTEEGRIALSNLIRYYEAFTRADIS